MLLLLGIPPKLILWYISNPKASLRSVPYPLDVGSRCGTWDDQPLGTCGKEDHPSWCLGHGYRFLKNFFWDLQFWRSRFIFFSTDFKIFDELDTSWFKAFLKKRWKCGVRRAEFCSNKNVWGFCVQHWWWWSTLKQHIYREQGRLEASKRFADWPPKVRTELDEIVSCRRAHKCWTIWSINAWNIRKITYVLPCCLL